jgi:hypothetical protein
MRCVINKFELLKKKTIVLYYFEERWQSVQKGLTPNLLKLELNMPHCYPSFCLHAVFTHNVYKDNLTILMLFLKKIRFSIFAKLPSWISLTILLLQNKCIAYVDHFSLNTVQCKCLSDYKFTSEGKLWRCYLVQPLYIKWSFWWIKIQISSA